VKREGHLFARIVDFDALYVAMNRASLGRRSKPSVAAFLFQAEGNLLQLQADLLGRTYQPGPSTIFTIHDPKERTIHAPPFRDRVVHHAVCAAVAPVFERVAIFDSYACRCGKGVHAAVARAQQFCQRWRYFLKLDVAKYYPSIDHDVLKVGVRRLVKDRAVLQLLDRIIDHGPPGAPVGKGLPIGNLTSQHFANLYLGALDHFAKESLGVEGYVRYMDDVALFSDTKRELWLWHAALSKYIGENLRLRWKNEATVLAPVSEGVPFLGLHIWPRIKRLTRGRRRRFVHRLFAAHGAMILDLDEQQWLDSMTSTVASAAIADTYRLRCDVFSRMMEVEG